MPKIPATINGVGVDFDQTVSNDVDQAVVDGLKHCIKTDIAPGYPLLWIFISSASDSHNCPSRHAQKKAVDISRINGIKSVAAGPAEDVVRRPLTDGP